MGMVTIRFPARIAGGLAMPSHAVTDGSENPIPVKVRPAGVALVRPSVQLPVDRSSARGYELQSRSLALNSILIWIAAMLFLSEIALFFSILASAEGAAGLFGLSGGVLAPWLMVGPLGFVVLWVIQVIGARGVPVERPRSYPTIRSGQVVVPNVNIQAAEEWRQLNSLQELEIIPA
jgi:hypothetical protein